MATGSRGANPVRPASRDAPAARPAFPVVPRRRLRRDCPRTTPSSIAWHAPCPRNGVTACAAPEPGTPQSREQFRHAIRAALVEG
jgi:hypothetical protein